MKTIITILALLIGVITYAQNSNTSKVELKNGSIIYCTVLEYTPEQIIARSAEGSSFILRSNDIVRITAGEVDPDILPQKRPECLMIKTPEKEGCFVVKSLEPFKDYFVLRNKTVESRLTLKVYGYKDEKWEFVLKAAANSDNESKVSLNGLGKYEYFAIEAENGKEYDYSIFSDDNDCLVIAKEIGNLDNDYTNIMFGNIVRPDKKYLPINVVKVTKTPINISVITEGYGYEVVKRMAADEAYLIESRLLERRDVGLAFQSQDGKKLRCIVKLEQSHVIVMVFGEME